MFRSRHVKDLIYTSFSGLKLEKFSPWTKDFNAIIGLMRAGSVSIHQNSIFELLKSRNLRTRKAVRPKNITNKKFAIQFYIIVNFNCRQDKN